MANHIALLDKLKSPTRYFLVHNLVFQSGQCTIRGAACGTVQTCIKEGCVPAKCCKCPALLHDDYKYILTIHHSTDNNTWAPKKKNV